MRFRLLSPFAALALGLATAFPLAAAPAGTAISYQGQLNDGGTPANGSYEFCFTLHDALSAGAQVGPTRTNAPVAVAGGEFTLPSISAPGSSTATPVSWKSPCAPPAAPPRSRRSRPDRGSARCPMP